MSNDKRMVRKKLKVFRGVYTLGVQVQYSRRPWLLLPEKVSLWIENPAGSNTISYSMMQLGIDVITNDASYYSYCLARGVLGKEGYETYEEDLKSAKPTSGWLTETEFLPFRKEVAKAIDGIAQTQNPVLLSALGKTLLWYTFRGHRWDRTRIVNETVEMFYQRYYKNLKIILQYVEYPREGKLRYASWNDWKEFLRKLQKRSSEIRDAILYSDFAWPWHPRYEKVSSNKSVYHVSFDIANILSQSDKGCRAVDVWTTHNVKEKLREYLRLVKKLPLKYFILSTQSTNYPEIPEIEQLLREEGFTFERKEFHGKCTIPNRYYIDYLFFIRW